MSSILNHSIYHRIQLVGKFRFILILVIFRFHLFQIEDGSNCYGQSIHNQGALITITDNTKFLIPDSIVNNGVITNNGELIVQGAWINNNIYNAGSGFVTLASTSPQVINHNEQMLTHLVIAGGGDKIFETDIIVENELILDDGLLVSTNDARLIVNEGASISGANDNSYVVGLVVHRGPGSKSFPIGTPNAYLPFDLIDVEGNSPEIGVIALENNPVSSTIGTLDEVSGRWHWRMSLVSGTFDGSGVRLAVNQESLSGEFEQFVVAETINSSNAYHTLGQGDIGGDSFDGYILSELPATGGLYAIGLDLSVTEDKPALNIFNAVTPNGDNIHDFLKIENIGFYPNNLVIIYDRRGKKVFEVNGYDNIDRLFNGISNIEEESSLPNGTYYYYIEKNDGSKAISGYFVLNK